MTKLICYSCLRYLVPNTAVTISTQVLHRAIEPRTVKKTPHQTNLEKQSIIESGLIKHCSTR